MEYLIAGTGNSSDNVIEAGLGDVKEGAKFHYLWTGKPTAGQARVLDWLLDYSADFTIYTETGRIPTALGQAANTITKVDSLLLDAFNFNKKAKVLLLWDENEQNDPTETTKEIVLLADSLGMTILDLTNGLVPIEVEGDTPTPTIPAKATESPVAVSKASSGRSRPSLTSEALERLTMVHMVLTYEDGTHSSMILTPQEIALVFP